MLTLMTVVVMTIKVKVTMCHRNRQMNLQIAPAKVTTPSLRKKAGIQRLLILPPEMSLLFFSCRWPIIEACGV